MIDEPLGAVASNDPDEAKLGAELPTDASPPDTAETDVDTENVEDGAEGEQSGPRALLLGLLEALTSSRITSRDGVNSHQNDKIIFIACWVLAVTLMSIPLIALATGTIWPLTLITVMWG